MYLFICDSLFLDFFPFLFLGFCGWLSGGRSGVFFLHNVPGLATPKESVEWASHVNFLLYSPVRIPAVKEMS